MILTPIIQILILSVHQMLVREIERDTERRRKKGREEKERVREQSIKIKILFSSDIINNSFRVKA